MVERWWTRRHHCNYHHVIRFAQFIYTGIIKYFKVLLVDFLHDSELPKLKEQKLYKFSVTPNSKQS